MDKKMIFEEWNEAVDEILVAKAGIPADCMGDYASWDCWDKGSEPYEGAMECIMAQDFYTYDQVEQMFEEFM